MKLSLKKDSQSVMVAIFVMDSSKTDGSGLTGLTYQSGSLTAYYHRDSAASPATLIPLVDAVVGTYTSGGFKGVDGTNMPGVYQLGIPDDALLTGADSVVIMLKGAANMAPLLLEIQLMDNTVADVISALSGGVTVAANNDKAGYSLASDQVVKSVTDPVTVGTNSDKAGYSLDAAERLSIADALLGRDFSEVLGAASRSALNALRFLRNKWAASGGTLIVRKEDDVTEAWRATITENAEAEPVTGLDPD